VLLLIFQLILLQKKQITWVPVPQRTLRATDYHGGEAGIVIFTEANDPCVKITTALAHNYIGTGLIGFDDSVLGHFPYHNYHLWIKVNIPIIHTGGVTFTGYVVAWLSEHEIYRELVSMVPCEGAEAQNFR
jgi:hypothetical protein